MGGEKMNEEEKKINEGVNLLISILVCFPEFSTITFEPINDSLKIRAALQPVTLEDDFLMFEEKLKSSILTYHSLEKTKDIKLEINIKKYEELAFINIIRDIKTLSRTEIVLISSIISNSFKEKLVCDKNDALQEEEILLQEEVMENMLSIMKKNHFSTRLIGIREEGKVIVFNK